MQALQQAHRLDQVQDDYPLPAPENLCKMSDLTAQRTAAGDLALFQPRYKIGL